MALVNVVNMVVLDNPTCFTNPFQFEITFECLQELDDDLEWKVLYVGSAQDAAKDQILDEILVGPVPVGVNKFVLQADAPDPSQLAQDDLLGVTVVLVTCSYKEREFVRVGYYVNNEYHDPNAAANALSVAAAAAALPTDPNAPPAPPSPPSIPNPVPLEHIQRQILADKPRVTKFPISWGDEQVPANANNNNNATNNNNSNNNNINNANANANNNAYIAQGVGEGIAAAANSTGAAMMADHASAMMTGAASMGMAAPMTVTPPVNYASNNNNNNSNNNNNNNNNSIMMEEEDIMEEEELSADEGEQHETGDVSSLAGGDIVSMPEESNMSHSYFGNGNSNSNGFQAMAE